MVCGHDRQFATMTDNFRNVGLKETSLVINQSTRNQNSDADNKRQEGGGGEIEGRADLPVRNCPARLILARLRDVARMGS